MNTKQLAAKGDNSPSSLFELSERESAGGVAAVFSVKTRREEATRECQETTYSPPNSLRGEKPHIKPEREMMRPSLVEGGGWRAATAA